MSRVLFYVQYLQGVGHLCRAANIARAIAKKGLTVDLVSGGMPVRELDVSGVQLHQLAPVKCRNGDFGDLIDEHGQDLRNGLKRQRRNALLSLFRLRRPAAIIIEAFPFGRRQMRFELLPLLEEARSASPKPRIICSVRDILHVTEKPDRTQETNDLIREFFDDILVHGDPNFARFDETFGATSEIAGKVRYTGLVSDSLRVVDVWQGNNVGEVVVSAGGGATQSERLLAAALEARPISAARDLPWRLLAGPNLPDEELTKLSANLKDGVMLERNRADFSRLLAECSVSVSQAGYNTVVDILRCGCPAVLAPYSARGQTEQRFRARRMHEFGLAQLVEAEHLNGRSLADALDAALAAQSRPVAPFDLAGAEKSASFVSAWLAQ